MADDGAPRRDDAPAVFTAEFFDQVNRGPLEAAYEERNQDPAHWNAVPWALVAVGIVIGLLFAYVNVFSALAVGITVGGSWYVSYFLGMVLRWRPGTINYVAGASTGASQVVLGAAFVLPALFYLSDAGLYRVYSMADLPNIWALLGFLLVGGVYGVLFFQFYRRTFIVDRPLQYPGGFESAMQLLAIADRGRHQDRAVARRSIRALTWGASGAFVFTLLRDLAVVPFRGGRVSALDRVAGSDLYRTGYVPDFPVYRPFYDGFLYLSPFFLGIGWFVRRRVALILLAGALLAHLLPFFDPTAVEGGAGSLLQVWSTERRSLAAGAILGAGLLALFRLRRVLVDGVRSLFAADRHEAEGEGESPLVSQQVILSLLVAGAILGILFLLLGGFPIRAILLLLLFGTVLVAVLGLIGVKVTGETATQPVSPLALLALMALLGILSLAQLSGGLLLILALVGTAFFATGLVMSTDVFLDFKVAHYIGNPPKRQALVQIAGLIPGILLGGFVVWTLGQDVVSEASVFFADPVNNPRPALTAPFGVVFAGFANAVTGGDVWWTGFILAAGIGAFVELATGLGTAFGVGIALQLWAPMTIFAGALLRDGYEAFFAPDPDRAESEAIRTAATIAFPSGLFVGEAVAAIVVFVAGFWLL